jgi:hypothetical protein
MSIGESPLLTAERLRELVYYDPETGIFIRKVATGYTKVGDVVGYKDTYGYLECFVGNKSFKAHRLAWVYMTGEFPKDQIDHVNGIKDDNRWCNLREATSRQNLANTKRYKNNSSGRKGVYRDKHGKYIASIVVNYKRIYLGYFQDLEDAHEAYKDAAIKYFGEFANSG